MASPLLVFESLLEACAPVFTEPSVALFHELCRAWILCPGRRTVTRMLGMLDPPARRAHDAYHRFLRAGVWSLQGLWLILAHQMVRTLMPEGPLNIDLDDTLFHRSGRKVEGAGVFRDAVRSTGRRVVYALGLNLVVLTLRVTPPWRGEPLGLPINVRLYRKKGPSHLDLAEEMIRQIAEWFPTRDLRLCADGAYATLAGRALPHAHVTSRMRRDAALYRLPPPRKKGKRGRPRKKGARLPTPEGIAKRAKSGWVRVAVDMRGHLEDRLLLGRPVLWFNVRQDQQVLLVIVRDPSGKQPDDFFVTTDLDAPAAVVASQYAGRWSIEDTFRNVKQFLGGEDPQTWRGPGPERAASLAFWLSSAVWMSYLVSYGSRSTWLPLPWYPAKTTASFADALAALRRALWRRRIFSRSAPRPLSPKIVNALIEILARAA